MNWFWFYFCMNFAFAFLNLSSYFRGTGDFLNLGVGTLNFFAAVISLGATQKEKS